MTSATLTVALLLAALHGQHVPHTHEEHKRHHHGVRVMRMIKAPA